MCSYCSCTAGLGQTCKHAAGLIFCMEHANRMGYSACTSMPCSWNVPSEKTSYGPKEVSSMTVKKSQYGKLDQRPLFSSVKKYCMSLQRLLCDISSPRDTREWTRKTRRTKRTGACEGLWK